VLGRRSGGRPGAAARPKAAAAAGDVLALPGGGPRPEGDGGDEWLVRDALPVPLPTPRGTAGDALQAAVRAKLAEWQRDSIARFQATGDGTLLKPRTPTDAFRRVTD
jgi:hypothetical protein